MLTAGIAVTVKEEGGPVILAQALGDSGIMIWPPCTVAVYHQWIVRVKRWLRVTA